ncbi:chemotaxis protein CheC [Neomoorella thermoacetica]|uniref:CheY-P phosphatase CheC n=2 Tax=Neomoorella thermoacetica TaxID=1525 RepID=A0A1D7X957_NEOTH|nr:chemotaxis protein CheC [Moorella thermoacetica]AOQ23459.1 CheY-P phosphatase CheC [Moorella thermoacetica]APC07922.1 CheY-P phosphatase CheC [Moorella thermoacetica]OIQ09795.1 CheY-P phosphatase CheC [Moorella thermoacetica]OIQ12493.1 CheY-P phosphatase CheC [Moorella thermoacetica]OIQ55662.1 CheY-P phosphatase CheC [Moorella thermoacetica]
MDTWDKLNALHLDALREIGNIGAGNAATSLASLLGNRVQMTVPRAGVLPLKDMVSLVGHEEEPVACVEFTVAGPAPSKIFFLLNETSAYLLVDLLLGRPVGTTNAIDDMGASVLTEVSNILAGSFLNAFSDFCHLNLIPSVPAFAFDMLGAVLSSAFLEGGYFSDRALVIETKFYGEAITINGHFFLVPEDRALGIILQSLGLQLD